MDGVLVIDKPEGMTSHDVVAAARRALHERRIGHTGTLDPLATGVLPLACGRATRLVRFLTASDKEYEATIRFGVTTDTYDVTGREITRRAGRVGAEQLTSCLATLTGRYLQVPPPYSAKKVDGVRAYALARRDVPVELAPVGVHVSALTLLEQADDTCVVRLTCSAGFYVRSFAHALGACLGTGGCLETLRRIRSGEFTLDQAITLDELMGDRGAPNGWLVPLERLLGGFPSVTVTDEGRVRVSHGRELERTHYQVAGERVALEGSGAGENWVRVLDPEGRLLALGQPGAIPGSLHPQVVLT
jgi:tRNA pseudouridine55 synthase